MSPRRLLATVSFTVSVICVAAMLTPTAAQASIDVTLYQPKGAKCKTVAAFSYISYNSSEGKKNDSSRMTYVKDTCTDSRSAVVRFWVKVPELGGKYEHFTDVWNYNGNHTSVSQKVTMPKGDQFRAQICRGKYGTRTITDCAPFYKYSGV